MSFLCPSTSFCITSSILILMFCFVNQVLAAKRRYRQSAKMAISSYQESMNADHAIVTLENRSIQRVTKHQGCASAR